MVGCLLRICKVLDSRLDQEEASETLAAAEPLQDSHRYCTGALEDHFWSFKPDIALSPQLPG